MAYMKKVYVNLIIINLYLFPFNLATSNNLVSSPDNRISKFGFRQLQGPLMSAQSAPTPI